jgi:uncharacterized membrane protein
MKQSTFDAGRVSALSDGVFAIAMTLLVLALKLPDLGPGLGRDAFAAALLEQAPRFASWLLSFAILCRLWISQHALLAEGDTRSRGFVGWTFLFLGAVSFIPFPTSLLSEHHDQALAVVIFSATLAAAGIALVGMRRVEQRHRPTNARPSAAGRSAERLVVILLATAAVSSGLAVFSPGLGALVWVAFPVAAALAGRRTAAVPEAADQ